MWFFAQQVCNIYEIFSKIALIFYAKVLIFLEQTEIH